MQKAMSLRLRNETVLTAALAAAAGISLITADRVWTGRFDAWFAVFLLLGAVMILAAFWSASLMIRRSYSEKYVRVPLISVTKDEFSKEPPIRGKRPQRCRRYEQRFMRQSARIRNYGD